jgi:hypothetical protein
LVTSTSEVLLPGPDELNFVLLDDCGDVAQLFSRIMIVLCQPDFRLQPELGFAAGETAIASLPVLSAEKPGNKEPPMAGP